MPNMWKCGSRYRTTAPHWRSWMTALALSLLPASMGWASRDGRAGRPSGRQAARRELTWCWNSRLRRGASMSQPGERPIRVLLVDDHVVVRKGLRALFEQAASIDVVGEAEDGEQALHMAERLRPEVILMDLEMPRLGGVE